MATLTISPLEEKRVKAMGFLSNKGTDNFSARIITVNGKITAEQQKVIAEAAEKFGNGIITFTTRLTIEVQGVPFDQIEAFQEYIAKAGSKPEVLVPWFVLWSPAKAPPVSMAFWIPSPSPRKFTIVSTRATTR